MANNALGNSIEDIEASMARLQTQEIASKEPDVVSREMQSSLPPNRSTSKAELAPYMPLRERDIRLVNFGATGNESALIHVSLDRKPEFTALSYCWGKENCKHLFEINGQILVLTSSLYIIFQSLQERGFDGFLWADAICINQDDLAEKAMQIPLMGAIYSGATSVIGWLGIPSEEWQLSPDSFDVFFRQLVESEYEVPPNSFLHHLTVKELGLPPLNMKVWDGLVELFASPWWTRLWVIQELVLASELTLYFGPVIMDFEELILLVRVLDELVLQVIFPLLIDTVNNSILAKIRTLGYYRFLFRNHEATISDLVRISSTSRVSQKNDSVYGLYSLVDFAETVPVDISISADRLFVRAAKAWRRLEQGSLTLLSLAVARPKILGVPSWVPDFSSQGLPDGLDVSPRCFAAGLAIEPSEPGVSMVDGEDGLRLQGFVLEHVDVVLSTQWPRNEGDAREANAQAIIATMSKYERFIAATLPGVNTKERRTILCRTMCVDMPAHARDCRQRFQESNLGGFDKLRIQIRKIARGKEWDMSGIGDMLDSIALAMKSRTMISTRGGKIGLATEHAQPGDAILILFGAPVPYVARMKPENRHYELIGDAYIDGEGIMDGEALRKHTLEGRPTEHFVFD